MNNQTSKMSAEQQILHQGLTKWIETQQDNVIAFIEQGGGLIVKAIGETEHIMLYETDDDLLVEVVFTPRENSTKYGKIFVYGYGEVEVELDTFLNEIVDFLRADKGYALSLDPPLDVEIDEDDVEIINGDDSVFDL